MTTNDHLRVGLGTSELGGFAALLGVWLVWTVVVSAAKLQSLAGAWPYLLAPPMVVLGVVGGRLLASKICRWYVLVVLVGFALVLVVLSPFYANAVAAVGVQLVGVAGLLLVRVFGEPGAAPGRGVQVAVTLLAMCGVLLAALSQAASGLVLVLGVVCVLALSGQLVVRGWRLVAAGSAVVAASWASVFWLASRASWPSMLAAPGGLSEVRRKLWADALALWAAHPVVGAGPGAFREYSHTAASDPTLAMVHSSVLQVGSELGAVGVVLFAGLLVVGMVLAARSGGAAGVIGVTAWTCLAVHSSVDHLYEFWPVTLVSGLVVGLAGDVSPVNKQE